MALLQAKDLEIRYGSKKIVKGINWSVEPGEHWVLFGLNGSGKTTLLSHLAGYLMAEPGMIELFGKEVTEENQVTLRQQVGWVSSSFFNRYFRHETVLEVVLSGKFGMLGMHDDIEVEDVQRAKALLARFGIKDKARYPYDLLSQGQRQRVLIARALINDIRLLLLDEPCGGLDIFAREYFLHLIQDVAEDERVGIVYVTHHTEEILPFFNKAVLMKDGVFQAAGNLKEVFTDERLSAFFEVPTEVLWTPQHFFLNLKMDYPHRKILTFA